MVGDSVPPPVARVRVLLCGAGRMGQNHLRVLTGLADECEVVGVVETEKRRRERLQAKGIPAFVSLRTALANLDVGAIVVATSTDSHHEVVSDALAARVPILVEKPVAATAEHADELAVRARAAGVPVMVGHVERFNPSVVALRRLVRSGDLGEILSISARRVGGSPSDPRRAGDVIVDLAVHDIDVIAWVLGQPLELIAAIGGGKNQITGAKALFRAGITTIDLHVNWTTPIKIRELEVTGSRGFVTLNLITQQVALTREGRLAGLERDSAEMAFDEYLLSFSTPDRVQLGIDRREPLREELLAFIRAVRSCAAAMPIPVEAGVEALRLAERVRDEVWRTGHVTREERE